MKYEDLHHLIEIQGLDSRIKLHMDQISSERKRVSTLLEQRKRRSEELKLNQIEYKEKKKQLHQLEQELSQTENLFQKNKDSQSNIKTQKELESLEQEFNALENKKEKLEEEVFIFLEAVDNLENNLSDHQNFLTGSSTTLQEIQDEVNRKTKDEEEKIEQYQQRIHALLNQCDLDAKDQFLRINERLRFKNPISITTGKQCGQCKFSLDQQTILEMDKCLHPQTCSNCGRFLLSRPGSDLKKVTILT